MSDELNKDKQQEIDDFFAQFDRISEDFNSKAASSDEESPASAESGKAGSFTAAMRALEDDEEIAKRRKTRIDKLNERQQKSPLTQARAALKTGVNKAGDVASAAGAALAKRFEKKEEEPQNESGGGSVTRKKGRNKKKRKYRINGWKVARSIVVLCLVLGIFLAAAAGIYVHRIISEAPKIDPDNIYSLLSENSVMYDDQGEVMDSLYQNGQGLRTNVAYADMPEDLVNAFVAIEDKTFWSHSGFNIIRMFGAVRDRIFKGNRIGGTSTITQQLARNLFLADIKSKRDLSRKVTEAYYAVLLERNLTKDQIIEAYLNTIYLGYNAYGVQAAAEAYFSKDVSELDLLECAALAALPKSPDSSALIKRLYSKDVDAEALDSEDVISQNGEFTYFYNGAASENRRNQALKNMLEQEDRYGNQMITQAEYDAARSDDLRYHMNPNQDSMDDISSYFTDYVINEVAKDLAESRNIELADAKQMLYTGGLRIYTTMNSRAQKIVEQEFADAANFPGVRGLNKDAQGNIISESGRIILYSIDNFFDAEGNFYLWPAEYESMADGGLKLLSGNRLNFYNTTVNGQTDYSIEFKNMYRVVDGIFYSCEGGYISIAQKYKSKDSQGNIIISSEFFTDHPDFFVFGPENITLTNDKYTMKQMVIQPQSAMVIMDYHTGHIKAMVGGRDTVGRLLYNRATSPHQPGSSIKPLAIYSAALQSGYEANAGGTSQHFTTLDNSGNVVPNLYGNYWTTASIIDDAPLILEGRQWPANFYSGYRGLYTLRTALQQSVNVCAVKIFQQLGAAYSLQHIKKMGITTVVEEGEVNDMNASALALGGMTQGLTPLESAAAYGTFPNGGVYTSPIAYTQVLNRSGELLIANEALTTQAMDPGVAFIMTDVLRSVVTEGIAGAASIPGQQVAGKTGTTGTSSDRFDIWFAGFTPRYSASLWIGNDVNIELDQSSTAAARLWSKIMGEVLNDGEPAGSYPAAPSNVTTCTIDTKSGKLPSELTALDTRGTQRTEYFIAGTQPTTTDDVHTYVQICTETGFLATPWCRYLASSFGVRRPYIPDPSVGDIAYEVPHYYCYLHNEDPETYAVDPGGAVAYTWTGMELTEPEGEEGEEGEGEEGSGNDPSWLDDNRSRGDDEEGGSNEGRRGSESSGSGEASGGGTSGNGTAAGSGSSDNGTAGSEGSGSGENEAAGRSDSGTSQTEQLSDEAGNDFDVDDGGADSGFGGGEELPSWL